jgi:hypothetical protein
VRSAVPTNDTGQLSIYSRGMLVHKVGVDGQSLWSLLLVQDGTDARRLDNVGSNLTVDDAGTTWIEGPRYFDVDEHGALDTDVAAQGCMLYAIADDGSHCAAHEMQGWAGIEAMAPAGGHALYYVNYDEFGLMQ